MIDDALRRFDGRVVAVTGAGSGIGAATARRLAAEGAFVCLLDLDEVAARSVASEMPRSAVYQLDVADAGATEAVVDRLLADHGRLDVMIANAGVTLEGTIWETTTADLQRVLDVNLIGAFNCAGRAIAAMVEQRAGAVVFTSSDAGLMGWPSQAAYCASKGAIVSLTRAAALDAAPYEVRVNSVCPAFTATPLLDAWIADAEDRDAARSAVARTQPLGRVAQPEEVAAAIAFLASDEARFITGVALPVDGGVTAQ